MCVCGWVGGFNGWVFIELPRVHYGQILEYMYLLRCIYMYMCIEVFCVQTPPTISLIILYKLLHFLTCKISFSQEVYM